jgi:hypothetical protein
VVGENDGVGHLNHMASVNLATPRRREPFVVCAARNLCDSCNEPQLVRTSPRDPVHADRRQRHSAITDVYRRRGRRSKIRATTSSTRASIDP